MEDIPGRLIGLLRRLTGGGTGQPRFSDTTQLMREQVHQLRAMPAEIRRLIEENPGRAEPLSTRAELELEAGDPAAALATAELLRARFPSLVAGYHYGCAALRRLRRFPEAEAMARAAMRRFPRAPGAWEAFAFCAQDQGDWPAAAARWGAAARRFPRSLWGRAAHAAALARAGDIAAAEAAIAAAARDWPEEWWPGFFAAEIAEIAADWPSAAARWAALGRRFPGRAEPYLRASRALRQAGDLAGAGAAIAAGIFIFPRDAAMLAERQAVLDAGGDPGPPPEA
jgi:predicted Zn-dependent protease